MEGKTNDSLSVVPMKNELMTLGENLTEQQLHEQLLTYIHNIHKEGTKVIVLIGGPACGKGTLAENMVQALGNAVYLSTDNYLKGDRSWRRANVEDVGKDPILKYDFKFLAEQIQAIKNLKIGEEIGVPVYDGKTGIAISIDPSNLPSSHSYQRKISQVEYLIVEGDFLPLEKEVVDSIIYMDTPNEVRLENRVHRDLLERGELDREKIVANFNNRQATQFYPYTLPVRDKADLIIQVSGKPLTQPTSVRSFEYTYTLKNREVK